MTPPTPSATPLPPAAAWPPGTVAVPTAQDLLRYPQFAIALASLELPPGSRIVLQPGVNVAQGRTRLLEQAVGDWVLFLDDDQTFPPDLLRRLLAEGRDVVAALTVKKAPPWDPPVALG